MMVQLPHSIWCHDISAGCAAQYSIWHHNSCTGGATTAFCMASWFLYWWCNCSNLCGIMILCWWCHYSIMYSTMMYILVMQLPEPCSSLLPHAVSPHSQPLGMVWAETSKPLWVWAKWIYLWGQCRLNSWIAWQRMWIECKLHAGIYSPYFVNGIKVCGLITWS